MKQTDFWKQVETRVEENSVIVRGGLPKGWAGVMAWVGLKFWVVGAVLSLMLAVWLWTNHYEAMMQVVRGMIWR